MSRNDEILNSIREIIDPEVGKSIVSLGFIKNLQHDERGRVSFMVELNSQTNPHKENIRKQCEAAVGSLPWVSGVTVVMSSKPPARRNPLVAKSPALEKVQSIIAVSSCKGGVGKSTTAVNLAYTLSKLGARVGLFDADVYGPSLPILVSPEERALFMRGDLIQPLSYEGVSLMSFGFVSHTESGGSGPAIMRGPMVTQVINQLLTTTEWGTLDYLILDLPPGTGDIQLTLLQLVPITAAVIVTTPQQISFVDVVKGIQMFDKLKVPTIAVVENMSYFVCPNCDSKHYIFGQGARQSLINQYGIESSFEIPLRDEIARFSDSGRPVVLAEPDGPAAQIYLDITKAIVREVSKIRLGRVTPPTVEFNATDGVKITLSSGEVLTCHPALIRRACRCAHCVEEFSHRQLLDPAMIAEEVYPISILPMGNYAVAMTWSDGHASSIFPYEQLLKLARGIVDEPVSN